ncbi:MAG TPA: FmdB family zinc ribbon protein [Acidimicrobiia bacterium]|nr:FmdB family zinc ribbon protein [Acidimicrobiia bacterium]
MPTYEYLCQDCGERLEVFQKFTDKPLRTHPECGGSLNKVFHASGVVFKGSGYYVTDSRTKGKGSPANSKPSNGSTADGGKPEKKTEKSSAKTSEAAAAAD